MAVIAVAHDDPSRSEVDEDGDLVMRGIHAHYNDSIGTKMASPRLAGRTSILPENIGPMEEITVDLPLHLENLHLSIDLTALQSDSNSHAGRLTALETLTGTHTTNIAANATAIATETSTRSAAFGTLASTAVTNGDRITAIETTLTIPGSYVSDANAAVNGVAVGKLYHNAGAVRKRLT